MRMRPEDKKANRKIHNNLFKQLINLRYISHTEDALPTEIVPNGVVNITASELDANGKPRARTMKSHLRNIDR